MKFAETQRSYALVCVCVQHRTLEAALDRGEKLDDLVGKSEELSLHSKAFYTTVGTASLYRKNWNIIRTIFTKNRGLVAGVRVIHVN